jgi:signal transduction histidine kinase
LSELRFQPEDLGAVLLGAGEELRPALAARSLSLQIEGPEKLGVISLHKATLQRALVNLIQRLSEAVPEGETLTVTGERTATYLHLSLRSTGKAIAVERWAQLLAALQAPTPEDGDLGL